MSIQLWVQLNLILLCIFLVQTTITLAVIEVKPVTTKINGLEKDLRTLKGFLDLEKGKYHLAIMLVYGDGEHDLPDDIISKVRDAQRDYGSRILLLWHKGQEKYQR